MTNKKSSKFYNKYETTYYDYIKLRFDTVAALINPFGEKMGKKNAIEVVERLSIEKSVENVKQVIAKNPVNNFRDFKKLFSKQMASDFMKNAVTYAVTEETDIKLKIKVTECLWSKIHKELNETELGYCVYCKPDFAMYETYHPKIKLVRTKTLMRGDDHCDHIFTWED